MEFDNAGFLVGRGERAVTKALIALDITEEVVAEAAELGAELIISHHPVIFHPAKQPSRTVIQPGASCWLWLSRRLLPSVSIRIWMRWPAESMTRWLRSLGLIQVEQLHPDGVDTDGRPYGVGRIGVPDGIPNTHLPLRTL